MRRIALFGPLVAMAGLLALYAFREGEQAAEMSESDAIRAVAKMLVEETGSEADCVGRPGADAVWVEVDCMVDGQRVQVSLDRLGRVVSRRDERGPQT